MFAHDYRIYVLDEERDSRVATSRILTACSLEPRPFGSGADFLDSLVELEPGIVLLRMRKSDAHAVELLRDLQKQQLLWPIIVLADENEVQEAVTAMKLGAFDVVEKPVEIDVLLKAIEAARAELAVSAVVEDRIHRARARIGTLSTRELEVLRAALAGHPNRRVAELLHISVRTVEMHRAAVIKQLGVETFAGAIRCAFEVGLEPDHAA